MAMIIKQQTENNGEPAVWFPAIRANTGADVFIERLASCLTDAGIKSEITWLPHRAEYAPWLVHVPKPPSWVNIVHVNSWLPRRFIPQDLPLVVTVHHLVHDPLFSPYRTVAQTLYHEFIILPRERQNIGGAQAVNAVSDYVRSTVVSFSGRSDIRTIPNWVELREQYQRSHDHRGANFRVLIIGSRTRRKGFHLLPAFAGALGPGFEIRMVGHGHEDVLQKLPTVVDLGRLDEPALLREYQNCDVVVSLSCYEGFGYTAVEAMLNEKPFVGFRTSALAEVVSPEVGILTEVGNVEAVAAAVRYLASSHELRGSMGRAGKKRAAREYGPENAMKYLDLYRAQLRKPFGWRRT
jgi:glycosyltransferase involved in cell wall biosynthesis